MRRMTPIDIDETGEVAHLLSSFLYNVKIKDISAMPIAIEVMCGLQSFIDTNDPKEAGKRWAEFLKKFGKHKDSGTGYERIHNLLDKVEN